MFGYCVCVTYKITYSHTPHTVCFGEVNKKKKGGYLNVGIIVKSPRTPLPRQSLPIHFILIDLRHWAFRPVIPPEYISTRTGRNILVRIPLYKKKNLELWAVILYNNCTLFIFFSC